MEQDSQSLAACFSEVCRQDKVLTLLLAGALGVETQFEDPQSMQPRMLMLAFPAVAFPADISPWTCPCL